MPMNSPIRHLEEALATIETELGEKEEEVSRLRDLVGKTREIIAEQKSGASGHVPSPKLQPRVVKKRARPSLNKRAGHFKYLEYNGQMLEDEVALLDHVGWPHYFSDAWERPHDDPKTAQPCLELSRPDHNHGHGDASQRQVLMWARRNPQEAKKVILVQSNGRRVSLWEFMIQQG